MDNDGKATATTNDNNKVIIEKIDDEIEMPYEFSIKPKPMIHPQSQYGVKLNDRISGNIPFQPTAELSFVILNSQKQRKINEITHSLKYR